MSEALERQGDKGQGQGKGEQGEGGVSLRKEVVLARVISHLDECFQVCGTHTHTHTHTHTYWHCHEKRGLRRTHMGTRARTHRGTQAASSIGK